MIKIEEKLLNGFENSEISSVCFQDELDKVTVNIRCFQSGNIKKIVFNNIYYCSFSKFSDDDGSFFIGEMSLLVTNNSSDILSRVGYEISLTDNNNKVYLLEIRGGLTLDLVCCSYNVI